MKSMDVARKDDPVRRAVNNLITIWKEDLKIDVPYAATDLRDAAIATDPGGELARPQLRELLLQQAGTTRGDIDGRRLGLWLTSIVGRIHDGHRIERMDVKRGGNRYALVPVRLV